MLNSKILKKIDWYTKVLCATEYPGGRQFLKLALKWGTLYHRICISGHRMKGICLTFNLVPRLVVYDKYQLRYD